MGFKSNAINELKTNFIGISVGVASLIFGIITWLLSQLQANSSSQVTDSGNLSAAFSISNMMVSMAFFLFVTTFASTLSRLSAKINGFFAFFISIILATLSMFLSYIFLNLNPPKILDSVSLHNLNNILFYATMVLFTAICGKSFGAFMARPTSNMENDSETSDKEIMGGVLLALFVLYLWGQMVDYGQNTLIKSFLPENWQPIAEVEKK